MQILIHTILVRRYDICIQSVHIQFEFCLDLPCFFMGQLLSMQYQVDENISMLKLYIDIFALYRHTFCYLHAKKCRIVNCLLKLEVPNMQVLNFCLPKESISEQLDSGDIDTGQKKESNKISSNYYLTVLVYIVNDEIQYYLIV